MAGVRRNTITRGDSRAIAVVAVVSALTAAFSDASPTGATGIDIMLVAGTAAFTTWAGASAVWWALAGASGLSVFAALPGPIVLTGLAIAALGASCWIAINYANQPVLRAAIAASVVQVSLRLEWDGRFLVSAGLAALAMGLLAISGYQRRKRYVRKRVHWGAIGVGVVGLIAIAMIGVAGLQARTDARDGYTGMLDGLEFLQNGDVDEANAALTEAADHLDRAGDTLGGPLSQLARFVPGVAQNRNAAVEVLDRAAAAATSAAETLAVVDLDQLTIDGGVIDVGALAVLAAPLDELERTVGELSGALHDAESPWLVPPFQSRLDEGIRRADQAAHQAEATAAAARLGPALLGDDEPRRYFLAFVNAAEARGQGGLMGNWSELTIENGRLSVTNDGRTARLQTESLSDVPLVASREYLNRYTRHGAEVSTGGVAQKYWSNVTMAADMPSVGNAMAQMYETATGRSVDGVFVIDAAGLEALLDVTGPIELADIGRRLDGGNTEQFLLLDQYEFAENEREDLLAAVTEQTISNVLTKSLPPPQKLAPRLAPAVLNGHISGWATRPEEQELFELVGMDGSLPVIRTSGTDAIAVVNNNASGNKIESFLERTIEYRPTVNTGSGEAEASMKITFTNTSPTTGYPDYVIGNIVDVPVGTNRMLVDVYTRLRVDAARINGETLQPSVQPELGYYVFQALFDVPAGESTVLELEMSGDLQPGEYRLVYRPQPLPNTDVLIVDAETSGGDEIFTFDGQLERRSVITRDDVSAWR